MNALPSDLLPLRHLSCHTPLPHACQYRRAHLNKKTVAVKRVRTYSFDCISQLEVLEIYRSCVSVAESDGSGILG